MLIWKNLVYTIGTLRLNLHLHEKQSILNFPADRPLHSETVKQRVRLLTESHVPYIETITYCADAHASPLARRLRHSPDGK